MKFLRLTPILAVLSLLLGFTTIAQGQEKIGEIMRDRGINWQNPIDRAQAVQRMKAAEGRELAKATALARKLGKPLREELPDGRSRVLAGIDDDGELLYHEDKNAKAAISTGADKLHTSPFSVDGSGVKVGVWEVNSPRVTHVEFNDGGIRRVNLIDSGTTSYHATHVTGTIAAFGVSATAKGMAYQTIVDAYSASGDTGEMTAAAATGAGQHATKVYVSNHSYGFTYGWRYPSGQPITWTGTGTDQNAYDADFGQYSSTSAALDSLHYNSPYLLAFWAAGNENTDGPSNGANCVIGGATVAYNSAIHPQNDGTYSGGFDTLGDHTTAKNVMVIGAVNDAETNGQRDPSKATKASFSSTGPCDDGRIKPDVVGNGVSLRSTDSNNDTGYTSLSGTSMSTPNVCGTAALLVDLYRDRFSGGAMRASTLRSLLIHTATDIGNPGPDYSYGWGLVDAEKAAELIQRQADYPSLESIIEDQLTTTTQTQSYTFAWDGTSAIRATLCWTDPAGVSESSHNNRTPDLVNNLNLKLIAPNGTEYFPYVMPFVGTWTIASMSQNATTGINNTDNVEQVLIANPGQSGEWTIEVSYAGGLTNNTQEYGLIVSGSNTAPAGLISFSNNGSFSVAENGSSATITVDRVNGTVGAVSVDYATSNGSATVGADYTAASGTLSWADGDGTSRTFTVPILNDSVDEISEESVIITLSSPSGTTISGANPATLSINDDDNVAPTVDAGVGDTVYLAGDTWTPTQISTALWYDAADAGTITESSGAVSQWNDKSGNANHLVQAIGTEQPTTGLQTIGGVNAVNFADDFMQTTTANSNIRAVFFVSDKLDGSTTNASVAPIFGETTANDSYTFVRTNATDYSISIDGNNSASGAASVFGNTPTTGGNINLGLSVAEKNSPLTWYLEYNGNVAIDYLGLVTSNETFHLKGNIGEFLALEAVPSPADRQKIEGYLAWKWGLEASLPLDHPYKSTDPSALVATANLDGTVTDSAADLAVMNTLWTLVSGPTGASVIFGDDTAIDTTATFTALGTYVLEFTADDGNGQSSDQVTIIVDDGSDTTAPTLASSDIVDDQGGAGVLENTSLSYTVTFSEDMDAATVAAGDFGNAGTAPMTIGAIAETSPGVFTVGVTPTGSGSLQFQVNSGAVITDMAGNALDTITAILDDTTITVENTAPVDHFAISPIPSPQTVGTPITGLTITAMTASNATATSFTGTVTFGGTAGVTGTSANFIDGVLSGLIVTPTLAGSDLTLTVDDGESHTGSVTITSVLSVYENWAGNNELTGEDAGPDSSPDGDSLTNLQEFAFGTDPTVESFNPLIFVEGGDITAPGVPTVMNLAQPGQPDDERAVFARLKNHVADGLTYTVEFSADLKLWTAGGFTPTVLTDGNSAGDYEAVSVPFVATVPVDGGGDPRAPKFMRVVVSNGS